MAILNFNAALVAPDPGQQDIVPAGWYNAAITASDLKPTKDGTGFYLECRFTILDGDQKDKKVYARLNIQNSNAKAVEIALAQLSAIAHAVGILQVQDSSQLHNRPLKIKVKVRPADGQYEAANEISAYKDINAVIAPTAQAAPGQLPAFATGTPGGAGAPTFPPFNIPATTAPQMPAQMPAQTGAPVYQQPPAVAPLAPPSFAPGGLMPQQPWEQQQPQAVPPPPPGVTFPGGDLGQQVQAAPPQYQQAAPQQAAPQQAAFQHPAQGEVPPWMKQ